MASELKTHHWPKETVIKPIHKPVRIKVDVTTKARATKEKKYYNPCYILLRLEYVRLDIYYT